jgi:hypothetical protein
MNDESQRKNAGFFYVFNPYRLSVLPLQVRKVEVSLYTT